MNIRNFNKDDHNIIVEWCNKWELPVTPVEYFSDDSFIVSADDQPLCIGSLFQLSSTPMYFIEGIISNPTLENETKIKALELLIDTCIATAKNKGASIIIASTPRKKLKYLFNSRFLGDTPEQYYHVARRL